MENAAKALTIAGEILIAVLILSLLAYAFVYFKDVSKDYDKSRVAQDIQKINTKFTKYLNEKVTAQDVVTVINTAKEYNEDTDNNKIKIFVGNDSEDKTNIEDLISFIKDNNENKYTCKTIKYNDNGIVSEIYFIEES